MSSVDALKFATMAYNDGNPKAYRLPKGGKDRVFPLVKERAQGLNYARRTKIELKSK